MILSNVNIGTGPSAGDGDTLRSAFSTINNNFRVVTNNVSALTNSVRSVAGRTGNIILTVNDVIGAASVAFVNSTAGNNRVISVSGRTGNVVLNVTDVANAASITYVNSAISSIDKTMLINNGYEITLDNTGHLVLNTDVDVFGVPGTGGDNDKIRLYDFANASMTNYAIGLENGFLWNSVNTTAGFKWYAGTSEILKLSGNGTLRLAPGADILNSSNVSVLSIGTGNVKFNASNVYTETGALTFYTTGGISGRNRIDFTADHFGVDVTANIYINAGDEARIIAGNITGQSKAWVYNPSGSITFPDGGNFRYGNPPPTSMGESDNRAGEIAFDGSYIYYCTADFDGSTAIWKRVAFSLDTW